MLPLSIMSAFTYAGIIMPPGPLVTGVSAGVFDPRDGLLTEGDFDLALSFSVDLSIVSFFLFTGLTLFDLTKEGSRKASGSDSSLISLDTNVTSLEICPLLLDK